MGLAERKNKQRIGADPRNLAWKDDASRFGHAYLAKHGWDPTEGLGLSGEGKKDYLRVAHKLDALGIGAQVGGKEDRDGRAGREYERLLRRLNEGTPGSGEEGVEEVVGAVVQDVRMEDGFEEVFEAQAVTNTVVEKVKKKKKKVKEASPDLPEGSSHSSTSAVDEVTVVTSEVITQLASTATVAPVPRRLAHRSRFLAAKRMAISNPQAVSEILGISTSSPTPALSDPESSSIPRAFPDATPSTGTQSPVEPASDIVKPSTLSVADYFKAKMKAKFGFLSDVKSADESGREESDVAGPNGGLGYRGTPVAANVEEIYPQQATGASPQVGSEDAEQPAGPKGRKKKKRKAEDIADGSDLVPKRKKKRVVSTAIEDVRAESPEPANAGLDKQPRLDGERTTGQGAGAAEVNDPPRKRPKRRGSDSVDQGGVVVVKQTKRRKESES